MHSLRKLDISGTESIGVLPKNPTVSPVFSSVRVSLPGKKAAPNQVRSSSTNSPRTIRVGFTGTRAGMTEAQKSEFRKLLRLLIRKYPNPDRYKLWFHHGDCIGADVEAAEIAEFLGYFIHVHPPSNKAARAFFTRYNWMEHPKPYSIRNQDIVRECDVLIATPKEVSDIGLKTPRGAGTWMTINYARRRNKPYVIIYPNGRKEGAKWRKVVLPPTRGR